MKLKKQWCKVEFYTDAPANIRIADAVIKSLQPNHISNLCITKVEDKL